MKITRATQFMLGMLAIVTGATISAVSFNGNDHSHLNPNCSYLNPPLIDMLAFAAGLYFVIDGFYHLQLKGKYTLGAALARIGIGVAIATIHIFQFAYK